MNQTPGDGPLWLIYHNYANYPLELKVSLVCRCCSLVLFLIRLDMDMMLQIKVIPVKHRRKADATPRSADESPVEASIIDAPTDFLIQNQRMDDVLWIDTDISSGETLMLRLLLGTLVETEGISAVHAFAVVIHRTYS
ncbi:hypothetical protein HAX54_005115 [Datura stramonium]|uniref:Uncharacterized protein n=1 Tax=Datura stramonium TaxID=4076 RepID=A0ABS8T856_DATST|nr:hypothetical protein [Datura stramonium]